MDDHPSLRMRTERRRLEQYFRDNYGELLAFARRRTPDTETAQDVVATTFMTAWRRRDDMPTDALPWLYGIARNTIGTQLRAQGRARALIERLKGETSQAAPRIDPESPVSARLAQAFNGLSAADREVLSLHVWEELGGREAARLLGCSLNAYTIRLHRARSRLARRLTEPEQSGPSSTDRTTPDPTSVPACGSSTTRREEASDVS